MNTDEMQKALADGVRHHQEGRLEQAKACYNAILAIQPAHANTLHLLGVIASQTGDTGAAIELIGRAIASDNRVPDFFKDLGILYKAVGRLEDSIACYRRVIELEPANADTLFNLGNALRDSGNSADAEVCYRKSLEAAPGAADALYNLGVVLQDQGRWEAAANAYTEALSVTADPMIHNNLGVVCQELGRPGLATKYFRSALELDSGFVEAHVNLGHLLKSQGEKKMAESCYRQAVSLKPDHASAQYHLGILLLNMQRHKDSIPPLRRATELEDRHADAWYFLGVACSDIQDWPGAAHAFQQALALRRESPDMQSGCYDAALNLANVLKEMDRLDEAIPLYRQTAAWRPDNAGAINNLGVALLDSGQTEAARPLLEKAVRLDPSYADARSNLGNIHLANAELNPAIDCYREAMRLKPDMAVAHLNLAVGLLMAGDFKNGWKEFQWRWDWESSSSRYCSQPRWRGEPLAGKTILLHEEQGFGDTIHFIRFAPWVAAQGGRVIVETFHPLVDLVSTVSGVSEVVPLGKPLPAYDYHATLLSLLGVFELDFSNIPASVPYMTPPAKAFPGLGKNENIKVGVVWAGKSKPTPRRSIPLKTLSPIFDIPGFSFFSLQVGPPSSELNDLNSPIVDLSPRLTSYADTAAAISQLDLVISVDTSVAHLAGALGKPVWTLLMHVPDWRWWLGRADSPWYPTMRLFRQPSPDDWMSVMSRVTAALCAMKD